MCILLTLHYAKFDVSSLLCSKIIEEKLLGGRLDPPLPSYVHVYQVILEIVDETFHIYHSHPFPFH